MLQRIFKSFRTLKRCGFRFVLCGVTRFDMIGLDEKADSIDTKILQKVVVRQATSQDRPSQLRKLKKRASHSRQNSIRWNLLCGIISIIIYRCHPEINT